METDSGKDLDSDSKHNGYIVLCRSCSHCTDSDSDPNFLFLHQTGIRVESVPEFVSGNADEALGHGYAILPKHER